MWAGKRKVLLLFALLVGSGGGEVCGAGERVGGSLPLRPAAAIASEGRRAPGDVALKPGGPAEETAPTVASKPGRRRLLIILILLTCQALLAAAETSFLAVGEVRARQFAGRSRAGRVLLRLLAAPTLVLTTLLFSITLLMALADGQATLLFTSWIEEWGWGAGWMVLIAVPVAMAVVSIPFVELLPMLYAAHAPERVSQRAAIPVQVLCWVLRPVVFVLNGLATGLLRLTGVRRPAERRPLTEEQIREAILTSSEQGQLPAEQGHILSSVFTFTDTIAKEAMVPRPDVTFLHVDMTVGEALQVVTQDVHSRFPVYQETPDRVIGVMHVKALLPYVGTDQESRRLGEVLSEQMLHPPLFIPETTHLMDLLAQMQREHSTLAVVIDEHGGVEGIVSIEDILEELVGDILDQEDEEEPELQPIEGEENTYWCHGRYSIDKLNRELGLDLPAEGYDTVAGFILDRLGEFPEVAGAEVVYDRLTLTVIDLDRDRHRIQRVRIRLREPEPAEGEGEEDGGPED